MTLEEEIGQLLAELGLTLATAESCTGGLVADRITNVAGSSAYFLGGLVTYADNAKEKLLGVQHQTLVTHGAVSEATAREMARGARRRLRATIAVSITGIAGPAGGTAPKPVGLTYIALAAPDVEVCRRYRWSGSRLENKAASADAALQLVLDYVRARQDGHPMPGMGEETRVEHDMVKFVNESVGVDSQVRPDGTTVPLGFKWHGHHYRVESWGRHSIVTREDRSLHCHLVQTEGGDTWELCQDTETAQWSLTRHWAARHRAV